MRFVPGGDAPGAGGGCPACATPVPAGAAECPECQLVLGGEESLEGGGPDS